MAGLWLPSSEASAQKFEVTSIGEKKIAQLPPGPLFWRIDTFASLARAQAAAGPTALAADAAGKIWLFTLGPKGGASPGGNKVAEIGPVPLDANYAEAFYNRGVAKLKKGETRDGRQILQPQRFSILPSLAFGPWSKGSDARTRYPAPPASR